MNALFLRIVLMVGFLAGAAFAADDTTASTKEKIKARLLEDAKKQAASPAAQTTAATPPKSDAGDKTAESAPPAMTPDDKAAKATDAAAKAKAEPATVLPKVEVNRSRINEIDRQIYQQEKDIAHEKEHTKPTEIDKALNDPKVSKALSVFGGESSSQRATIASERVKIMEEEKDLLEAMKTAKTKEEKAELQKELDELRAYRRQLEKTLR